jgi:transketolase
MSVGMAIAEKWLANRYNRPSCEIFDYNIYKATRASALQRTSPPGS